MNRARLEQILNDAGPAALAVSGGIDSLTLAALAVQVWPTAQVFHAVSAAVPAETTQRVRQFAEDLNWDLVVLDAGEMADPNYRANPINRCLYCKTNLYTAITARCCGPVFSGTNLDDLGDYRPGLIAARDAGVRHPYVEAEFAKSDVRALAQDLGLGDIADLPAAPCLASRVTTGLRIEPQDLGRIDRVETAVRGLLGAITVRCRQTAGGLRLQLDAGVHAHWVSVIGLCPAPMPCSCRFGCTLFCSASLQRR